MDTTLELIYNSQVWHRASDGDMIFDMDGDWPAPGWALGFGKLVQVPGGSMLVDASGARHPFTGTLSRDRFNGKTTDGSFIDYQHVTSTDGPPSNWKIISAKAFYPDGMVVEYRAKGVRREIYPTRITDVNGNFMTVTYRNNEGPEIESIIDTMGRTITFHYEVYEDAIGEWPRCRKKSHDPAANEPNICQRLTAITAPGHQGERRTLVRLHYAKMNLRYRFTGLPPLEPVMGKIPKRKWQLKRDLIDSVFYPESGTGYWFGDPDSFSSYGMVNKWSERRGMTFNGSSLTEQGTITPGRKSREDLYNYPVAPIATLHGPPAYTTKTETWEDMDTPPAVTSYLVEDHKVTITHPDGIRGIQWSHNQPGTPLDGVVFREQTDDLGENRVLQYMVKILGTGRYRDGAHPEDRTP